MKKRFLAMLLAMLLVITSLPMTVLADSADNSAASSDPLAYADWSENVTDVSFSDAPYNYVHVYGDDHANGWLNYADSDVTLSSEKTYRLSFQLRGIPRLNNASDNHQMRLLVMDSNLNASNVTFTPEAGRVHLLNNKDPRIVISDGYWGYYSILFTGNDSPLSLRFRPADSVEDAAPYDIRYFSLYEIDADGNNTGNDLIKYASQIDTDSGLSIQNAYGWSWGYAKPAFYTECGYSSVATPTDGSNANATLGNLVLTPGKYSLSAKFRLNTLDFSLLTQNSSNHYLFSQYTSALTVTGGNGVTVEQTESLTIGTTWSTGTYTLNVTEPTTLGELSFMLDKAIGFDIADLKLIQTVSYNDNYASDSGEPVEVTHEYIADGINSYMHASNLRVTADAANYIDNDVNIVAGEEYKLSFYVRAAYSSDWTFYTAAGDARPFEIDGEGYTDRRFSLNGCSTVEVTNITNEWQYIETTVTPTADGALSFTCWEKGSWEFLPYDIAGLSVVKVGTTDELIAHADELKTDANNAGWYASVSSWRDTFIPVDIKVDVVDTKPYNQVSGELNIVSDDVLTAGVYKVSGDFRLPDIKASNMEIDFFADPNRGWTFAYVVNDNNKATVSALNNGEVFDTAEITTDWTTAEFELVVPFGTTLAKSDISFTFGDAESVDFKDIEFILNENKYNFDYIDGNGNYAVIGDETIADDVNEYVRLSNVRISGDGMSYTDEDVTVTTDASYDVSFYIRSTYSSEWIIPTGYDTTTGTFTNSKTMMTDAGVGYTQVRVSMNGSAVSPITPVTPEWQKVNVTLTAKNSNALSLVFNEIGGEDNLPYEIAGLSIVESGTTTELVAHGLQVKTDNNNAGWYAVTRYRGSASIPNDLKIEAFTAEAYNQISAPEAGVTELNIISDDTLGTGIYYVSGDFRLPDYKSSNVTFGGEGSSWNMPYVVTDGNVTTVSAYYNGEVIGTADVTTAWSTAKFELAVPAGTTIAKSDISFVFGDACDIDFKNIEITLATDKYNFDYTDANGDYAAVVNETIADVADSYMHASNLRVTADAANYIDNDVTIVAGEEYKISFYVRAAYSSDWTFYTAAGDARPFEIDGEGYTARRFSLNGCSTIQVDNITSDWQHIEATITPTTDGALNFTCWEVGSWEFLPYDIAGLSLVKSGTTDELIAHADELKTDANNAGWYAKASGYRDTFIPVDIKVDVIDTNSYSRVSDELNIISDDVLTAGVYKVSGDFRLPDIKASNMEIDFFVDPNRGWTFAYVVNDNNKATVSALINGEVFDTAEITTDWTNAEFVLIVPEGENYNKNDISFAFADTTVDFKNITIEADDSLADQIAAAEVYDLIEAIGDVTLESGDAIVAAETAYAALTDTQKVYVTNYETLTAARATYDALVAAEETAKVQSVINAIDAIGEVTLESEEAIVAAEAAYAELTDAQKALVTNNETLTAARATLDELKLIATSVAKVGDAYYATIEEALAADGDITLLANIENEIAVAEVVSIIKNGFTANVVAADGYELIETDEAYNVYTAVTKFDLSGVTMTLGASLSLDFAIDTANLTGTDNYAKMTIVYADGSEPDTIIVPQSEWTVFSGKIYTAKFTGMAAKQMNDVVTAVVYNANGQVVSNAKSDSIETYAVRMLNGSAANNAKLRAVYVDMLNYGAAAQVQFTYDEANLANRNLTEAHQAWATTSVETVDNRVKGTGYVGSTLTLAGEIQLDLVFQNKAIGTDYSDLYALITYTDHYGNAKEIRIEGADFIKYSSSYAQVSITGMAVADFRSVVSCVVYDSTGAELANAADSVESYANRNSANLGATVDTIVKFGESSYNYFH